MWLLMVVIAVHVAVDRNKYDWWRSLEAVDINANK